MCAYRVKSVRERCLSFCVTEVAGSKNPNVLLERVGVAVRWQIPWLSKYLTSGSFAGFAEKAGLVDESFVIVFKISYKN